MATIQLLVALVLNYHYDHWDLRALLVGAIYALAYLMISAGAALRSELITIYRGPARAPRGVGHPARA